MDVVTEGRIKKIKLPKYSMGEELISSISHGAGAGLSIAALVLCIAKASAAQNVMGTVSVCIYGASLIILYMMSSIYHSIAPNNAKRVFRVIDHCSIFLLIAGTYTPFTMITLADSVGRILFFAVWIAAVAGIVLNALDVERFQALSMVCYLAMGWCVVLAYRPLASSLAPEGIRLLVAGGLAYTLGAVVYGIGGKVKYMHSIWHFFVLAGSILHFFCIYLYVL